jgi:hypothetical protein
MPSEESRLIETLRVFCITAMMWVHVNPGVSSPSVVTSGDYALVGAVFGNTLGRVSVSLLSFISGYLLWQRAKTMPVGGLAMRRFRSVLVPMLVWSAIYILLALMKEPLSGIAGERLGRNHRADGEPFALLPPRPLRCVACPETVRAADRAGSAGGGGDRSCCGHG